MTIDIITYTMEQFARLNSEQLLERKDEDLTEFRLVFYIVDEIHEIFSSLFFVLPSA